MQWLPPTHNMYRNSVKMKYEKKESKDAAQHISDINYAPTVHANKSCHNSSGIDTSKSAVDCSA